MLQQIQIETTNYCNGKCVFCPVPTLKRHPHFMPMDLFRKIVDDCAEMEPAEVSPFLNGEPFTDDRIFERIAYINEKLPGARVTLYSNANLLTAEKAAELAKLRVHKCNFSINAVTEESRMELMGLSLQTALENIFRYKDLDPTVHMAASMVLDPTYVDGTDAAVFKSYWEPRGIHARIFLPGNWAGKLRKSYSRRSRCCRPDAHLVVMNDGRVPLCCFDPEGDVILGDAKSQTLREIWDGETAKHYREKNAEGKRSELPLCSNCTTI